MRNHKHLGELERNTNLFIVEFKSVDWEMKQPYVGLFTLENTDFSDTLEQTAQDIEDAVHAAHGYEPNAGQFEVVSYHKISSVNAGCNTAVRVKKVKPEVKVTYKRA